MMSWLRVTAQLVLTATAPLLRAEAQTVPVCGSASRLGAVITRDSAAIEIVESWFAVRRIELPPTPTLRLGLGSDTVNTFVSVFGAARLSDGRIVVADDRTRAIRIYDGSGGFVRQVGRRGQGPGEFQSITAFQTLAADTLMVTDGISRRITFLAPDGRVLRAVSGTAVVVTRPGRIALTAPLRPLGRLPDGSFLAVTVAMQHDFGPAPERLLLQDTLVLHKLTANVTRAVTLQTILTTPRFVVSSTSLDAMVHGPLPFGATASAAVGANYFVVSTGHKYELHVYSAENRLIRIARVCETPREATAADRALVRDRLIAGQSGRGLVLQQRFASEAPYPRRLPAYTALRSAKGGQIWAKRFAHEHEPVTWDVFDAQGHLQFNVTVPVSVEPLEIGSDYLLARFTDEDGVQSVRSYRL